MACALQLQFVLRGTIRTFANWDHIAEFLLIACHNTGTQYLLVVVDMARFNHISITECAKQAGEPL